MQLIGIARRTLIEPKGTFKNGIFKKTKDSLVEESIKLYQNIDKNYTLNSINVDLPNVKIYDTILQAKKYVSSISIGYIWEMLEKPFKI